MRKRYTNLPFPFINPYANDPTTYTQAGEACREQGNQNLAFMLLNRYVDIAEAIESQDTSLIDNTEYHDTGTYPAPIALLLNSLNALKTVLTSRYHYHLFIVLAISYPVRCYSIGRQLANISIYPSRCGSGRRQDLCLICCHRQQH